MTHPAPAPTPRGTTPRPGIVEAAFWLYLLAPIVGLVLAIVGFGSAASAGNAAAARAGISSAAVTGILIAGIVVDVVLAIAVIVVDLFFRRGATWARIVMTILGALTFVTGGAVALLISAVAILLSWLPTANAWFRSGVGRPPHRTA